MTGASAPLRLCVTGATGFIGARLTQHLTAQGHQVRALLRPGSPAPTSPGLTIVRGDLTVPESLPAAVQGVDAVIHLGGVAQASRPDWLRRVNVDGTIALARAAREAKVPRFIFLSSLAAQGPSPADRPPPAGPGGEAPVDPYGRSKLEAETALRAGEGPRWTTVLRPGLVLGPGDGFTALLRRALSAPITPALTGLEVSVLALGDLIALVDRILEHPSPPFGPFFAAHPEPCSFESLLDAAERVVGRAPSIRLPLPAAAARWLAPLAEQVVRSVGQGTGLLWLRDIGHQRWTCDAAATEAAFGWSASSSPQAAIRTALQAAQDPVADRFTVPRRG